MQNIELSIFTKTDLFNAGIKFFNDLGIELRSQTRNKIDPSDLLSSIDKNGDVSSKIGSLYFLGIINDSVFGSKNLFDEDPEFSESIRGDGIAYKGYLIFAIDLLIFPRRADVAEITRKFNRISQKMPVAILFRYQFQEKNYITISLTERMSYSQPWRAGEKIGKIVFLRNINTEQTHSAHMRILSKLNIHNSTSPITSFNEFHKYWLSILSVQELNIQFYKELQSWFYHALEIIKLPIRPDYISESEHKIEFLIKMLSRLIFCWFIKEKGLIPVQLLELRDWNNHKYILTSDVDSPDFVYNNSYYRGILQNLFYNSLNKTEKKEKKAFKWLEYIHPDFDYSLFSNIPYLNGGIFEEDKEADNAKESISDDVLKIPNSLFYGNEIVVNTSKGIKRERIKGINEILNSYKFTIEENTPAEEDIALDPELLGLIFENLLAELDPNTDESVKKSIRKLTGSYYTPRKVIIEMTNDSLYFYMKSYLEQKGVASSDNIQAIKLLAYDSQFGNYNPDLPRLIVDALDKFRVLDPACGSGAFPMVMLQRMTELLKIVDPGNELWIEIKLSKIDDVANREQFRKILTQHLDDYSRKLGLIRDSIYCLDIQPIAIHITKLRFFISLLIEQNIHGPNSVTPMPHIETNVICANTLNDFKSLLLTDKIREDLIQLRKGYFREDLKFDDRLKILDHLVDTLNRIIPDFATSKYNQILDGQNQKLILRWLNNGDITAPFFDLNAFFPEINEGFDCIIGNPPYGGEKISNKLRESLGIESKDPYGAFIARFINEPKKYTPLKHNGVLAFIVSDTFLTIKSHLKLRQLILYNKVLKIVRMHPDTFGAMVNTAIILVQRIAREEVLDDSHHSFVADFTNINIHTEYSKFSEYMNLFKHPEMTNNIFNDELAIYTYPQNLIKINSNLPIFVASPKIFKLLDDRKNKSFQALNFKNIDNLALPEFKFNEKLIRVVKLKSIANVLQGLATGDNDSYIFKDKNVRGNYREIGGLEDKILTEIDLAKIRENDNLKNEVVSFGINISTKTNNRFLGGRYIIPYEKGGESDTNQGWLPNYYVSPGYYIDWSETAVHRMKTLTIAERIKSKEEIKEIKNNYLVQKAAVFRNTEFYFKQGINFSITGIYAPSFRISSGGIFDVKGSFISSELDTFYLLGLLCSKLLKYISKGFIYHTVDMQVDAVKELPIAIFESDELSSLVKSIINRQKIDAKYDYASNEQIKIDKIIYEAYGLQRDDVIEVEKWYERRYPKLAKAQKENLKKLGKSTDYLELYGMK